ncbi:CDP-glycerol glycerophosphotransferase family protein [Paenibacillus sp. N4]|uniref:CDP-glycerol glycerophosphotransferase family protein n=1 Tax=Paenibacillus vietnamensis TaxID=2590547 RepID=UPI001CD11F3E|nr:CDP-glycerol glycerophosphotransferase family protein [Paenibacillus vietnamensis]MCA0754943.1 CDP-glycerol glycerophosphotransferase family protein [Paenibacillus vietnamensis]
MINTYDRNYWSLYFDFIDGFKRLNYAGFLLPFVFPFERLIAGNEHVKKFLNSPSSINILKNNIKDETSVQKKFDSYINALKNDLKFNHINGYVVMYDDPLRFPDRFRKNYFRPKKTLFLNESKLNKYTGNINRLIKVYKQKAILLFRSHRKHPIFGNRKFQKRFIIRIPLILGSIVAANKLLKKVPIYCIILGSTNTLATRALALAALKKGIPSICMQHGVIASELGYLPKISPTMAVYGKYESDWYERKGVSKSSIEIIGHPRFDDIILRNPITRNMFNKKLVLNPKLKTILFIIRGHHIAIPKIIIKNLLEKQHVNIIVKYKGVNKYANLLKKEFPSIICIDQAMHLYDLIHNTDAVVSYQSTIALEAMLAGKPVFIWNTKIFCTTDYYDDLGKSLQSNPLELVDMLVNYLKNDINLQEKLESARKQFITYHYHDSSITSGERLKNLVLSLTPKPKILIESNSKFFF